MIYTKESAIYSEEDIQILGAMPPKAAGENLDEDEDMEDEDLDDEEYEDLDEEDEDNSISEAGEGSDGGSGSEG